MHDAARQFCESVIPTVKATTVAEIGARNVNGSIRYLLPVNCIGVDILPGPNVDWVADAATWEPGRTFDLMICCEMLEHAANPAAVVRNMVRLTRPGGRIVITAATPEREPHSGIDGEQLREGEQYQGITAAMLREWLANCSKVVIDETVPGDIYCVAYR